ncbi:hypothetical protein AK830_g8940 [Neonectria ditissima]|uniref:Uncharacterized protein n=1 Tax=Neonectria ditissima TaxID=78410 RepID=A0A0P7BB65_9HYPO|nr:hypothetical protein AK830_g8940 [Neonectria ditissima]
MRRRRRGINETATSPTHKALELGSPLSAPNPFQLQVMDLPGLRQPGVPVRRGSAVVCIAGPRLYPDCPDKGAGQPRAALCYSPPTSPIDPLFDDRSLAATTRRLDDSTTRRTDSNEAVALDAMRRLRHGTSLTSEGSAGDANAPAQEDEQPPEYILKELYVPPAAPEGSSTEQPELIDLVFVHGLGGNLRTTWKVEGTAEPWFSKPEFLGSLDHSVRVLSFGYNANRFGDVANTRIIHHANALLRNLVLKRLDNPNRPIIFIAHSLGGLVVKRAILLCATNNDWSAIKNSTKSIIFMGTPHMGSEKAEDLVVVQKLASLIKFQSPVATNLTKELKTFSNAVQDINMEFTIDVHRSIELLCCYESHPQRLPSGSEIIVPQWSAVLQGVDNIDLNCHHSGLSKFRSPTEPRFELFWGEVQRLARKATAPPQKLLKVPTWTDEETAVEPTPARARQVVPSRRRHEVAQKGVKPSRASIIRSSADEILKEVRSRIAVETPAQQESTVSPLKTRDVAESIDPREFADYTRQLRTVTPENRGLDREPPHWQTCQWILADPKFVDWKESEEGSMLFVTGNPGCGKSNLAKYIQGVMEEPTTEDSEPSLVVSFYCDSLESSRVNPPILDLVVRSLLSKQRTMSRPVRQKLTSLLENFIPDRQKTHTVVENDLDKRFNHLMEVVQTLVMDQNGVPACLIIDGLNQCEDTFILRLLRGLDSIFRREGSKSNLKVLITSRMADSIRGFALANSHVEVTSETVEADIQRVVDEEVDRIIMARQIATIAVTSVSAVIVERSNGSFLFAASVLKELWLIKDTGANSVFTLVTSCPSTMEAIYQQDMDRLEAERPDLFRLVQILCIAKRAIRVDEAREILRMQNPEITENYDLIGDLTRMCQRLVKFGGEDTLELLHQTLYDFIINTYEVSLIHEAFAEICLQYLSGLNWEEVLEFSLRYRSRRNRRHQVDVRYPLLDYACPWMGYHWRHAGAAAIPKAWDLWDFICSENGRNWQRYSMPKRAVPSSLPPSLTRSVGSSDISSRSTSVASRTRSDISDSDDASSASASDSSDSDDSDDSDGGSSSASSSSAISLRANQPVPPDSPKPPLVILAQWDVDYILRELFFDALESTPRQLFHKFLSNVPYLAPRSTGHSLADFKAMVNEVWDGTTAVHYAAAQTGKSLEVMLPYVNDIDLPDDDGATPLILAAASGEIKGVTLLLEAGADIDHADDWRQTALYSALHSNSGEVVEILLQYGADPNIPAESGHTPLEVVVGKNHDEYAKILLEYHPDVTAPMTTGQPPAFLASRLGSHEVLELLLPHIDVDQVWDGERIIHNACWRGLESVIKKLIKLGANLDDPPICTPKATPVALAAECGHNSILKALLGAGARVECPLPNMSAPLHIAAARGNFDACRQLIRAGCNIEVESERNRTALFVATDANRPAVVELLVNHGANPDVPAYEPPLQIAADIGNLSLVTILLAGRNFPDVDAKGETGETALGIASTYGDLDMVSCLIDHGADPDLRSGQRLSNKPLQLAAHGKHQDVMIELLKRGADPFPEHPKESSPFHTACLEGYLNVVKTFFEVVDNDNDLVNFEWGWYGTPLLQAALGGRLEIVELLLGKGADPDYKLQSKINNGKTLIHAAAEGGDIKVLEAILAVAQDPDLEVCDLKKRTPLYYACVEGRDEMVDYLLEKGVKSDVVLTTGENLTAGIIDGGSAKILDRVLEKHPDMDVDIPREDGKTPIFFAVMHGYDKIIKTLLERGADANRRCNTGEFPLAEAIRYREKFSLQALLEHKGTDLTQLDVYGRGILQISQQAGSHPMPGMILAAAKTPELEATLTENRDMFGNNAYDPTRIDIKRGPSWQHCIETIRKDAESLLNDFSLRGPRWERLGKFFLQLSAYSFAQIALQRSVEAVEMTPLFLEHQDLLQHGPVPELRGQIPEAGIPDVDVPVPCLLPGQVTWDLTRGTETEESESELGSDSDDEGEGHGHLRSRKNSMDAIPEEAIEDGGSEDERSQGGRTEGRMFEEEKHEEATHDDEISQVSIDTGFAMAPRVIEVETPTSPTKVSERDAFEDPLPDGLRRAPSDLSLEEGEVEDEGEKEATALIHVPAEDEYVELTEEQLREFLDAVLRTFTLERTPDTLAKWRFSPDSWKLEYDDLARAFLGGADADTMPDLLRPKRGMDPIEPLSDAYEFLAAVAFLLPAVPLTYVLTQIPFTSYERRAMRKRRQLQKLRSFCTPVVASEPDAGMDRRNPPQGFYGDIYNLRFNNDDDERAFWADADTTPVRTPASPGDSRESTPGNPRSPFSVGERPTPGNSRAGRSPFGGGGEQSASGNGRAGRAPVGGARRSTFGGLFPDRGTPGRERYPPSGSNLSGRNPYGSSGNDLAGPSRERYPTPGNDRAGRDTLSRELYRSPRDNPASRTPFSSYGNDFAGRESPSRDLYRSPRDNPTSRTPFSTSRLPLLGGTGLAPLIGAGSTPGSARASSGNICAICQEPTRRDEGIFCAPCREMAEAPTPPSQPSSGGARPSSGNTCAICAEPISQGQGIFCTRCRGIVGTSSAAGRTPSRTARESSPGGICAVCEDPIGPGQDPYCTTCRRLAGAPTPIRWLPSPRPRTTRERSVQADVDMAAPDFVEMDEVSWRAELEANDVAPRANTGRRRRRPLPPPPPLPTSPTSRRRGALFRSPVLTQREQLVAETSMDDDLYVDRRMEEDLNSTREMSDSHQSMDEWRDERYVSDPLNPGYIARWAERERERERER